MFIGKWLHGLFIVLGELCSWYYIVAYGNTPYVGMIPEKMAATIKGAQLTHSKCLH